MTQCKPTSKPAVGSVARETYTAEERGSLDVQPDWDTSNLHRLVAEAQQSADWAGWVEAAELQQEPCDLLPLARL